MALEAILMEKTQWGIWMYLKILNDGVFCILNENFIYNYYMKSMVIVLDDHRLVENKYGRQYGYTLA